MKTTPTIGLIFECGPQGADKQVCEYIVKQLCPKVEITSKTLNNKKELLQDAGRVAAQLLKDGCCCVLVVWDLRPAWPNKKEKPCRAIEREQVLKSLKQAGVLPSAPVYLVCIEQELESWLIACDHAIAKYLSTPSHPYTVKRCKNPDQAQQPKALMINHFKKARGWVYEDRTHAVKVLQAADIDWKRLRKSVSFTRFELKVNSCFTSQSTS